jgi:hypothetical protein
VPVGNSNVYASVLPDESVAVTRIATFEVADTTGNWAIYGLVALTGTSANAPPSALISNAVRVDSEFELVHRLLVIYIDAVAVSGEHEARDERRILVSEREVECRYDAACHRFALNLMREMS